MFTFSQGIFPSPGAHASAECKEADIQAVGSSTLAGFDAGIQVTVNTRGMAATLERHGTCICVIVCLMFIMVGILLFSLWFNSLILYST